MQALVQGREIEHLLVRFSKLLERNGLAPEATWVVDEAKAIIDTTALGKFIGTLNNKSLSMPLSRMQRYLKAEDKVRTSVYPWACCITLVCSMHEQLPCGCMLTWQPQSRHPWQQAAASACSPL